jgi:hypothetical protein
VASSSGHPDGAVSTIALDYHVRPRSRCDEVVRAPLEDIWLPDDHPDARNDRFCSEQYAPATFLRGGGAGWTVELPCWFVSRDPELSGRVAPLFANPRLEGVERHGGSFWMERAPLS